MKTNSLKIISMAVFGFFVLGTSVRAQGPATAGGGSHPIVAKQISKLEAEKKYPPTKGGVYPPGERDPHQASGLVASPYPPHQAFDCAKVPHGALVLDTRTNKVFVRP